MKILQVNNYYGERSTGKLTQYLHEGLQAAGIESLVVYGRGKCCKDPGVIRLCPEWYAQWNSLLARITGMPHGGCLLSTWKLIQLIRKEKPDVVHLQCINEHFVNIYRLVAWLKKNRMKTILSLHAEFMHTANCGYAFDCDKWKTGCHHCERRYGATKSWFFDRTHVSWERMRRALDGFERDCIVAPVSPWTQSRAMEGDILKQFRFCTVLNGVNTDVIHRTKSGLREELGIREGPILMNISHKFSIDPENIKGGYYLYQLAKRMPDVTFLVAGPCEQNLVLPENIRCLGFLSDQRKLAECYSAADLTLMLSKRETFSMPCAESLCCGTPVVGFRAGAPEQISLPEYSEFIRHGDLDGAEQMIRRWLEKNLDRCRIAREAEGVYSAETMIRKFLDIYRSVL